MSDVKTELKTSARMPPYVSFSTFLTFVEELKVNGVPPQIDGSVLKRFAGGVRTHLVSALKYLSLMTDDKKPTDELRVLAATFGDEPKFKDALRISINKSYSFLSAIDLKTATPTMFAEEFRKHAGGQEAVLYKCRTFYLQAAKFTGIELGQRLTAGSASTTRAPGTVKAAPRKKSAKRASDAPSDGANGHGGNSTPPASERPQDAMMEKLLEKFPKLDPKWPAEIQAKWFDGFNKLMASVDAGKKDNGGT